MADQRGGGTAAAVLEAPEVRSASATGRAGGRAWQEPAPAGALQRGYPAEIRDEAEDGADSDDDYQPRRGAGGAQRWSVRSMFRSVGGRIVLAMVGLIVLAGAAVGAAVARNYLLHDPRFVLAGSDTIKIQGIDHLTRGQVLDVFGGDLERNIFRVNLGERRADLERLPWVEHATVMRVLPDSLRVEIKERTPVAFVRQGTRIGLVDANGVLLDMPAGGVKYSFPVLTGISASDTAQARAVRLEVYGRFLHDLESGGKDVTRSVSEVDVTDPEDVKALMATGPSEVLVHFGDTQFLARYKQFAAHLPEWRQQYPKLASADMRYDGQIVLEMRKDAVEAAATGATEKPAANPAPQAQATAPKAAPVKAPMAKPPAVKAKPVAALKAKPAVKAQPAKKKVVKASKPLAKPAAAKGTSKSNEKMFAALAAQRKAAEAKAHSRSGATP